MSFEIRPMILQDHAEALSLWQRCEGVGLSEADSRDGLERFLARNPGTSFVALAGSGLVGTALCGHDGRRGYLHHLAVDDSQRRRDIGRSLVARCLDALAGEGIDKCHLFVLSTNPAALAFWKQLGWAERTELVMCSAWTG
jgi:ribosomal protein S18 acetylase RimI-like enzyme